MPIRTLYKPPLIQRKSNLDEICQDLMNAGKNGELEKVKLCLSQNPTKLSINKCFKQACQHDQLEIVKFLLEKVDINYDDNVCIQIASCNGYYELVRLLIDNGADIQTDDNNSFRMVSSNGHLEIVELLLLHGANVQAQDNYAIRYASQNGHLEVVKLLIANGADVQAGNNYALRYACQNQHLEVVRLLLAHGADVQSGNNYALRHASHNGYLEIAILLIEHGANVQADYNYALRHASRNGYLEIAILLIEHGANVQADYNYALRRAIENGHLEIVKLLINHGADIQTQDNYALRRASENGHLEIVKLLIDHGANIKVITKESLNIIKYNGHSQVAEYLTNKLKYHFLWKKLSKSVFCKSHKIPRADWQKITNDLNKFQDVIKEVGLFTSNSSRSLHIDFNKLQKIIKESNLFTRRTNNIPYSPYLLKVQLAIQMTWLTTIPMITYNHIDCNNINSPISHDLSSTPEHELIKDKYNNWYHITDLIDDRGYWKINSNPYTNEDWSNSLSLNYYQLQDIKNNYVSNKLHEIHELKLNIDIHLNTVRTIMIELDKSTNSNHLDQIDKIDPTSLLNFFKKEVVCLEYFRNYTTEELSVMKDLSGYELFHKFLVITRTIMTDVNLSCYIGEFLET